MGTASGCQYSERSEWYRQEHYPEQICEQSDGFGSGALSNGSTPGVHFVFSPEDATLIHFDVIRSFDRPLIHSELLEKMADKNVKTELDWQLYQLQRRYLDYQVNIGNRIIECLTSGGPDGQLRAAEMSYPKTKFQDLMDDLFGETGKKIHS